MIVCPMRCIWYRLTFGNLKKNDETGWAWVIESVMLVFVNVTEYAGNIGDAMEEEAREAEQDRILQLLDDFAN